MRSPHGITAFASEILTVSTEAVGRTAASEVLVLILTDTSDNSRRFGLVVWR